jgi:hypothetical protein
MVTLPSNASIIGCALLTKRNDFASGGWASIGGQESFRFSTLEALRTYAPLWVLSTPEQVFATDASFHQDHLRHAGFLPTPVTAIAEEVAPPDLNNFSLAAQRVSEILGRVMTMADAMAPASNAVLAGGAGATLTAALQQLAAPMLRSDPMHPDLLAAMPSLFKAPMPPQAGAGNDIAVRLPASRVLLCDALLNMLVPGSEWTELPAKKLADALSWAIGDEKQIIAKVSIRGPLPRVKTSAPMMRHLTRGAVRWMALPEIAALSGIVEMTAERVFLAEESVPVGASMKVPPPVFSPQAMASISAGLLAETYLHAACMPASVPKVDGNPSVPHPYSARAAWLMSTARALMMQEALALSAAGYSVIGYGPTHVLVSIAKRNLKGLRKTLSNHPHLSYPAGLRFYEERSTAPRETHELAAEQESQ